MYRKLEYKKQTKINKQIKIKMLSIPRTRLNVAIYLTELNKIRLYNQY